MTTEVRRLPKGKQASVNINTNARVESQRSARRQLAFAQRVANQRVDSDEVNEDGVMVMERQRVGRTVMYKPHEDGTFAPRTVSNSSVGLLLALGWSEFCPKCGGDHLDRQGKPSTDPNLCPANEPVAVRACPVCRKRIYDNMARLRPVSEAEIEDDPNLIRDEVELTTPEQRTRLQLDLHLWRTHPRQAQMMGRPPLPGPLREIVENVQV